MGDYSAVAPPQQNFNDSTAFAAAVQRAKQIAAKIKPAGGPGDRPKRPLEDGLEPDAKKIAGQGLGGQGAPGVPGRGLQPPGMGGLNMSGGPPPLGGGPQINEDIKVPDKMVGLIIGRGGEQITRLQAESGCKIQMAPDSAGTQERICSLSGTREAISRAKELILNIVHQRGRTEGLDGLNLGPGLGQGMNNGGLGAGGGGGGGDGHHEKATSYINWERKDGKSEPIHFKAHPEYHYGWKIADDKHHVYTNKDEHRDGYKVKGTYSLLEADGKTIRVVDYTADKKEGFNAKVTYKKHN